MGVTPPPPLPREMKQFRIQIRGIREHSWGVTTNPPVNSTFTSVTFGEKRIHMLVFRSTAKDFSSKRSEKSEMGRKTEIEVKKGVQRTTGRARKGKPPFSLLPSLYPPRSSLFHSSTKEASAERSECLFQDADSS